MDKRMKYKRALLFVAALLPVAIIGGLFTGIYTFAGYAESMKQQLYNQLGGYGQYPYNRCNAKRNRKYDNTL